MSREFGLYPPNREPQLWIGCRTIITVVDISTVDFTAQKNMTK